MNLRVWIPLLPPGINQTYLIGNKHLYKSKEAVAWEIDASYLVGSEAGRIGWEDNSEYYEISISLYNSNHDVDASIKLILDVVSQKLGFNDKKILKQCSEKIQSDEKGVLIELKSI